MAPSPDVAPRRSHSAAARLLEPRPCPTRQERSPASRPRPRTIARRRAWGGMRRAPSARWRNRWRGSLRGPEW